MITRLLKTLAAGMTMTLVCLASPPDVHIYPGSSVDELASKSVRKSNPDNIAYSTADAFEKVDAYYKSEGSEDVPHSRNISSGMKYVALRFPGKKFRVQLSWMPADSRRHGTLIQFVEKP